MKTTFVILTHNRRDALLRTLGQLHRDGHMGPNTEIIVVDNGSTDGTGPAIAAAYPTVDVIRREKNEGVSARNHAFPIARGRYVVLIDDDSYPLGDAIEKSTEYMDSHADVGAVVGRVVLPDGGEEASAFPSVTINCAVCLRKKALDEVVGFPREFFRQAEEYDLSFRIWQAGYRIVRFEDVVYRHEKAAGNRARPLVCRMDLRNNLILAERYLPAPLRGIYRNDWALRYGTIACHLGFGGAARLARWEARVWQARLSINGRQTLGPAALESIFGFEEQKAAVAGWAHRLGIKRVAIGDFSKNIYATLAACRAGGLCVTGVADNQSAFSGLRYRGLPLLPDEKAIGGDVQGIVLSNVNPAQVERRLAQLAHFGLPVLRLWHPVTLGGAAGTAPAQEARRGAA